jgi:hypothetical protein
VGKRVAIGLAVIALVAYLGFRFSARAFPPDRTPDGAYLRIAKSIADGDPRGIFPYLETDAQWASFTIRDERKKALERVRASYPPEERAAYEKAYAAEADAPDGPDVFALLAEQRGWIKRRSRLTARARPCRRRAARATRFACVTTASGGSRSSRRISSPRASARRATSTWSRPRRTTMTA